MRRWQRAFLITVVFVLCSGPVWAQCPMETATLDGTYLHTFQGNGYVPVPKDPLPSAAGAPFVAAGQTMFDGDGQGVWHDSASLGGLPILNREVPFNYELNADCRGVITSPLIGEVARIVAAPDGSEVLFINSFHGTTVTGLFRKVDSGDCSPDSFSGKYRSLVSGAVFKGGSTVLTVGPSRAFAGVGVLEITNGTFEWTSTDSTGGKIEHRIVRGTHQLDLPTCRALAQATEECLNGSCTPVPAGSWTAQFTASPDGDALVYVNTTTNITVAGRLTRQ